MRRPGDDRSPAAPRREPRDALPPGTLLGDGYRVERTLGQGGFGIVYLATDLTLQRPMAIKEYLPVQLAGRGEGAAIGLREAGHKDAFLRGLQSFLREARLLAQFDHPSLVRVYRFWEENHTAYMAMPYCEGPTLQAARQPMLRPPDETWLRDHLMLPLLGALQTLHDGHCLHRDVSPGNIIIKPDGQPVLLDFGSARRVVADMTQPLTAILNPSYAAIEQYAESSTLPQGAWTDLYGLAAVAYFALSGRAPVPATVRAVNEAAMMPIAEVARVTERSFPGLHYSAPFLAAIDQALAVRPADRPQAAQTLREALLSPHVRPDVTVESPPPLQAVPSNKAADAKAAAPAKPEADGEEAQAEKAIRAAIDAALADVADWPPMSRGPQRVEPQFGPAPAGVGKAALKVVPGGEAPVKADAGAPAPARPASDAPLAQVPPQKTAASMASPPKAAAHAPAPQAAQSAPVPKNAPQAPMPQERPSFQSPRTPESAPEAWAATAPAVASMKVDLDPLPSVPSTPATPFTQEAASSAPAEATTPRAEALPPVPGRPSAGKRPPVPDAELVTLDTPVFTALEPPLDFARFDHAGAALPPSPARRPRASPWLAAAALAGLVLAGAWYAWPEWNEGIRTARAPAPARPASAAAQPASAAQTQTPVLAETSPASAAATPAAPVVAAAPSPIPAAASSPTVAVAPSAAAVPAGPPAADGSTATAEAPPGPARDATSSSGTTDEAERASSRQDTTVSSVAPPAARPRPTQHAAAPPPAKATSADPRGACGTRTNFSLYYCMKTQCRQPRFASHPQCQRLRESDEVS
jgi:serine/threonine protein kinase